MTFERALDFAVDGISDAEIAQDRGLEAPVADFAGDLERQIELLRRGDTIALLMPKKPEIAANVPFPSPMTAFRNQSECSLEVSARSRHITETHADLADVAKQTAADVRVPYFET
jgi:hypothetical protein